MKRIERNQARVAVGGALLLVAGLGIGYWMAPDSGEGGGAAVVAPTTDESGREVLYWYDPMVPDQHFDQPGKSPFMDMALVPRYADEVSATGVRIDPAIRQNLGMRTAVVEVGTIARSVRVPGTLTWDLRAEEIVSTPVDAIVSRLNVRAPYQRVRAGTPLAVLLAPEWGTAIAEARSLAGAHSAYGRELRDAARQRLRMVGLEGTTAVGNGSVVLRSPRPGVVSELLVREGEAVLPGASLFRINGTETLWLEAALPQGTTDGIGPGTPVEATVDAIPGRTFSGEVETLLPEVDAVTRARRARIVLRNEGDLLAPGMFAQVSLQPSTGPAVPLVPTEALITTGTETRVIVVGREGRFQPVRVSTGRSAGGRTEILEGLQGGERVVTSGQFLVDSEASLSGALDRMTVPNDGSAGMEGMDMDPASESTEGER